VLRVLPIWFSFVGRFRLAGIECEIVSLSWKVKLADWLFVNCPDDPSYGANDADWNEREQIADAAEHPAPIINNEQGPDHSDQRDGGWNPPSGDGDSHFFS
jgi:hypothetical protein